MGCICVGFPTPCQERPAWGLQRQEAQGIRARVFPLRGRFLTQLSYLHGQGKTLTPIHWSKAKD